MIPNYSFMVKVKIC